MLKDVFARKTEIERICRTYSVARLELFGSAARGGDFDPATSDLDFLVQFEPITAGEPLDQYFGLAAALESLFGRSIDLVESGAVRNPFIQADISRTKRLIYES
jgi:hypothetical protein